MNQLKKTRYQPARYVTSEPKKGDKNWRVFPPRCQLQVRIWNEELFLEVILALAFAFEMRVEIGFGGDTLGAEGRVVDMIQRHCSVRIDCQSDAW